jgi:hypothetical protein
VLSIDAITADGALPQPVRSTLRANCAFVFVAISIRFVARARAHVDSIDRARIACAASGDIVFSSPIFLLLLIMFVYFSLVVFDRLNSIWTDVLPTWRRVESDLCRQRKHSEKTGIRRSFALFASRNHTRNQHFLHGVVMHQFSTDVAGLTLFFSPFGQLILACAVLTICRNRNVGRLNSATATDGARATVLELHSDDRHDRVGRRVQPDARRDHQGQGTALKRFFVSSLVVLCLHG